MKNYLMYLLCIVLYFQASGQEYSTGLIFDDESYQKVEKIPTYGKLRMTNIPVAASLKKYAPTPGNQGWSASCVGWCISSAMTIMHAKKYEIGDQAKIDEIRFSPDYVYNQIKGKTCDSGAYLQDGLELVKQKGDLFESALGDISCEEQPTEKHHDLAKNWKIKEFNRLFDIAASGNRKIFLTKKSIVNGKPVMIGGQVRKNLKSLAKPVYNRTEGDQAPDGGHAMVVVGYDDKKEAFEVMNSWGTNWANKGFFWLKYDDFAKIVTYSYVMTLNDITPLSPKTEKPVALQGSFEFLHSIKKERGIRGFEPVELSFKDGVYTIKNEIELFDWFQLKAKNVPEGKYVYVFSVDPANKSFIHWPRNEALNEGFLGLSETPLVNETDAEIIIPGENNVMVKDVEGADYLCILYANEKMDEKALKEKIDKVKVEEGNLTKSFDAAFADVMMERENIIYNTKTMHCSTKGKDDDGYVIPIILKVEAIEKRIMEMEVKVKKEKK